jgi:hypothetical protein
MVRHGARASAESLVVFPRRVLWSAACIVWLAFTTPVFLALYLLSVPRGHWLPFAIAHAALLLAFVVAAMRLRGAGVRMSADGIREREYFSPMVFTPVETIAGVMIVRVRDSYSDEVSKQVFFTDAAGDTLLRLRSPLWHARDLARMIDFYGVPVRAVETEMTWRQLRHEYARNLDRWERHPVLTVLLVGFVLVGVATGAVLGVMAAIG